MSPVDEAAILAAQAAHQTALATWWLFCATALLAVGTSGLAIAAFTQILVGRRSNEQAEKLYKLQREDLEQRQRMEEQRRLATRRQVKELLQAVLPHFSAWSGPERVPEEDALPEALLERVFSADAAQALGSQSVLVQQAALASHRAFIEIQTLAHRSSPPPDWRTAVTRELATPRLLIESTVRDL